MAAGLGGPRPREHNLHPGQSGMRVPHNGLQLPGRQDPGRAARPAGHPDRAGERVLRLLERPDDERHLGPELHEPDRREAVPRMLCKYPDPKRGLNSVRSVVKINVSLLLLSFFLF